MSLQSRNSQGSSNWGAQQMDAMEKAKRLRDDRKITLARTGELAIGNTGDKENPNLVRNPTYGTLKKEGYPLDSGYATSTMNNYGQNYASSKTNFEEESANSSLKLLKAKRDSQGEIRNQYDYNRDYENRTVASNKYPNDYNQYGANRREMSSDYANNENYRKPLNSNLRGTKYEDEYDKNIDSLNKELGEIERNLKEKSQAIKGNTITSSNKGTLYEEDYTVINANSRIKSKPPLVTTKTNNSTAYNPEPSINTKSSNFDSQDFSNNTQSRLPRTQQSQQSNNTKAPEPYEALVNQKPYTSNQPGSKNQFMSGDAFYNKGPGSLEYKPSTGVKTNNNIGQGNVVRDSGLLKDPVSKENFANFYLDQRWKNDYADIDKEEKANNKIFSKPIIGKKPTASTTSTANSSKPQSTQKTVVEDNRPVGKGEKIPIDDDEEEDDPELYECPQGCGRKFKTKALEKHAKVCLKVFQTKRKEFNAAEQRQTDELAALERERNRKAALNKKKGTASQQNQKKVEPQKTNDPKWKQQSEAFRANLKAARGENITAEEEKALSGGNDDLIPCPHCERKFNEKAAERHIPFCESKSKIDKGKKTGNSTTAKGKK